MRLVVAITGASGVIYGERLLQVLQSKNVETHLIISKAAEKVIEHELETSMNDLKRLANHVYDMDDWSAPMVSGSFKSDGMVIIPCSMKTLAGIVHGYSDNIILRTADVTLKEERRLIIVPRETPLSTIHLRNMLKLAEQNVTIIPAMPAYYHKPQGIDDLVNFVVGKVLDRLEIEHSLVKRWQES
ncbi:MAG: UbiX family flavin prenyltransferase [Candidatus Bathyarchaeota archaeon]|nr:MAG: UbiX family flavin prenyltransferase [Candidatus Bathyarchaeota archaeon]